MRKSTLRTWVEISKVAVLHNVRSYEKLLGKDISIMAVIKSNAYGHGLSIMADLLGNRVRYFSVAFIEEALALRKMGVEHPILVFSTVTFDRPLIEQAIREDISFTVYDDESYRCISSVARSIHEPALVHVNVDTGMSRLGFPEDRGGALLEAVCDNPFLTLEGLYTHLSSADSDIGFTKEQCDHFEQVVAETERVHCAISYQHVLNTPAAMLGIRIGNVARIGLGLFGLSPAYSLEYVQSVDSKFSLKPVLSFKTRVIQVREVPKGVGVGYGRSYIAKSRSVIAVVPIGFSDGYSRMLSNRGEMLVKGVRCPVRGRVCMNNTMIDVTDVSGVRSGDEVTVIGSSGKEQITADDIADILDTTSTEVVTMISESLPRI